MVVRRKLCGGPVAHAGGRWRRHRGRPLTQYRPRLTKGGGTNANVNESGEIRDHLQREAGLLARAKDHRHRQWLSEEDLVSNLIGFYRALFPLIEVDELCKPVSVEASKKIWNTDGPVGVKKNKSFTPRFHKCDECKNTPAFPQQFQVISAAPKGILFQDYGG